MPADDKCRQCVERIIFWSKRVEYRAMPFCSKECLDRYKKEKAPKGYMRNKGSRTTPCGPAWDMS